GRRRRRIVAEHSGEHGPAAERRDVVRHVGGAAEADVLVLEEDDRDRRLGRDPRHAADDEPVEHDIAGHEHGDIAKPADDVARPRSVEAGQRHAGAGRSAAKGSVTMIRNIIWNSESPKLYSNIPAVSIAIIAASAAAARNRSPPA